MSGVITPLWCGPLVRHAADVAAYCWTQLEALAAGTHPASGTVAQDELLLRYRRRALEAECTLLDRVPGLTAAGLAGMRADLLAASCCTESALLDKLRHIARFEYLEQAARPAGGRR